MKASGNGDPRLCAQNLLRCVIGEVPYERVKGLNPRIISAPSIEARRLLKQDANWLVRTYEPRVNIKAINITPSDAASGGFSVSMELTEKEA